jgi:preflagellin peptidase FlaK
LQELFTGARIGIAVVFLLYSSWSDHKTREVENIVWALFAPLAAALTLTEICLYQSSSLLALGFSVGLTVLISFALFYSGGFGGADAKALMCLSLALPFYPVNLFTPLSGEISPISQTLFPVVAFSNGVLFAAATAVYMLFRNLVWRLTSGGRLFGGGQEKESVGKKVLVLLTGYKMPVHRLKEKWHLYPLEDTEETPEKQLRRKLVVIPRDETRNATVERLSKAVETGTIKDGILATPGLPMLIFITAGLIVGLVFGDLMWIFVRLLLR